MRAAETNSEFQGSEDGVTSFGWMLVIGSLLSAVLAFIHPSLSSSELEVVMRELVAQQTYTSWMHGLLLATYGALVVGFFGFTRSLGLGRPSAVGGLVFYAAGALALTSAAVINGFALAMFAGRNLTVRPDDVMAVASAFNMAGSIAAVWAAMGAVAMSIAIFAWSALLVRQRAEVRMIGGLGMVIAVGTILFLVTGSLVLDVHGFLLLVISQAAWSLWLGTSMIRGLILKGC